MCCDRFRSPNFAPCATTMVYQIWNVRWRCNHRVGLDPDIVSILFEDKKVFKIDISLRVKGAEHHNIYFPNFGNWRWISLGAFHPSSESRQLKFFLWALSRRSPLSDYSFSRISAGTNSTRECFPKRQSLCLITHIILYSRSYGLVCMLAPYALASFYILYEKPQFFVAAMLALNGTGQ